MTCEKENLVENGGKCMNYGYLSQEEINVLLGRDELQFIKFFKNDINQNEKKKEESTGLNSEKDYVLVDNSVLLVFSDFKRYYFDKVYARVNGKKYDGTMQPHIGMIQDSCIITIGVEEKSELLKKNFVDIRYFPHFQHLEMYVWSVGELPVYMENSGQDLIYVTTQVGVIQLNPGKRVLVDRENAMECNDNMVLSKSDLYPAII